MTFPDEIDNTMREAFTVCPLKFWRAHLEGWGPTVPSVHLHFGGAMARGLEIGRRAYFSGDRLSYVDRAVDAAKLAWGDFDPPAGSFKTLETLEQAVRYYFDTWPLSADTAPPHTVDGVPQVEWWFREPIPGSVHPDHGGPIYYCGRSDYIPCMNGLLGIEDDKTAGSLGKSWSEQWKLDSQFTGYTWARRQQGHEVGYILVRGVSILKPKYKEIPDENGTEVGKNGQAVRREYDRVTSFGHDQALVYRPEWMVERWLAQLQRDVQRMVHSYMNNTWDAALHKGACEAYGGCTFKPLCLVEHPEDYINSLYVRRKWNPLAHV